VVENFGCGGAALGNPRLSILESSAPRFVLFQKREAGCILGRPWIDLMVGRHNQTHMATKHFPELRQIEVVPLCAQRRQIFFRKAEEANGRSQPASMLRMGRMFELFLQMDKSACGLNQPLEILRIVRGRRLLEPDLLENIMRLIVSPFVPAEEKSAIVRMIGDGAAGSFRFTACQRLHEFGNSLAFAHEGRNLIAPAMMGKRARFTLSGGRTVPPPPPQR